MKEKYQDEILLDTTVHYNATGIAYLPIIDSTSILIDAGMLHYELGGANIVPLSDILGYIYTGSSKDVGSYEWPDGYKNIFINASHPNASDDNHGTDPEYPWATLKHDNWSSLENGSGINIAAGTYTWADINTPTITKSIIIQGSSKEDVIIQGMSDAQFDADNTTSNRLAIIGNMGFSPTVKFKNLTLRNARITSGVHGGFMQVAIGSTLILEEVVLEKTKAVSRFGGALNVMGNLSCTNVSFQNNKAAQGGAIYFNNTGTGTAYFNKCKFISNTTDEGTSTSKFGGAIYLNQGAGLTHTLKFNECLFDSNESIDQTTGQGGALRFNMNLNGGVDILIENSAFINNKTYGAGSAIATSVTGTADASTKFILDIRNTTFTGNQNHESGTGNGTTINIFNNANYNSTCQRGAFNLVNNTFFNNTQPNATSSSRSVYATDSKINLTCINNVFLDSDPAKTAWSVHLPTSSNPSNITMNFRGNIGDKITVQTSAWENEEYHNVRNKYNDEILLDTIIHYTPNVVAYLPISSFNSILIDAGFRVYEQDGVNIIPQFDMRDHGVYGSGKDVGAFESYLLPLSADFDPAPDFFLKSRQTPLVDLNPLQLVYVSDYGAIPDDGQDDRDAIYNAVMAANALSGEGNPVRVLFEKGVYDVFYSSGGPVFAFEFSDLNYLVIDGNQSEIINHNPEVGFMKFNNCNHVIVQNFYVDYETGKLPFTQGVVTAVNTSNRTFDFTVDEGFPLLEDVQFTNSPQSWATLRTATGQMKPLAEYLFLYNNRVKISDRVYRITQSTSTLIGQFAVGDYFVPIARYNGRPNFYSTGCANITFLNITSYASLAAGYSAMKNEEWNIINCNIKPKTGRVHSINADCIHTTGCYIGPWVQGCVFEAYTDDAVNMKYLRRNILSVVGSQSLIIEYDVNVGDSLNFFDAVNGVSLGEAVVTDVQNLGNSQYEITLSEPVSISRTGDHQSADRIFVKSCSNESFVFRNNTFKNGRRYGIVFQNRYGIVENNIIENLSGSAIRIENFVDWKEGYLANNIIIRNNYLSNCGFDRHYLVYESQSAAITSYLTKVGTPCNPGMEWCGNRSSDYKGFKNIEISNNTIIYNKKAMHLEDIDGLILKNNIISRNPNDPSYASLDPVHIDNCVLDIPQPVIILPLDEEEETIVMSNNVEGSTIYAEASNVEVMTAGVDDLEKGGRVWSVDTDYDGYMHIKEDEADYPGATGASARSYSFWIKPDNLQFSKLLYSGDGSGVFTIQMENNGVVRVGDSINWCKASGISLSEEQWSHVAVVMFENSGVHNMKIYINGVLSSLTNTGTNAEINTGSNVLKLFPKFKGRVSDFRYYDVALIKNQIDSVYQAVYNPIQSVKTTQSESQFDNITKMVVFPTITSGVLSVSESVNDVKIFNISGSLVREFNGISSGSINISDLKSGLYIIQLNNSQFLRIIKKD